MLWAREGIDIRRAVTHFSVQPPQKTLQAEITYEFFARDSVLVWDFGKGLSLLHLTTSFALLEMRRDAQAQTLTLVAAHGLRGSRHTLTIRYEGEPISTGFGSFEVKPHATGHVLWTLSQPYGARDWLFCQDDLADKVDTLLLSIQTPPDYIGVGNGRLVSETFTPDNQRLRTYEHRYPVATYLIAIAASNYIIQTHTIRTPFHTYTLQNYVFPQDTAQARRLTDYFMPYFTWIEEKLGPYPFADEGYNQVQIGWGGGMEHQTITFFGTYSLELWAHELAHQWFGDLVTCGSWQDIWINESFATLLGGKVYEVLPTGLWPRWRHLTIQAAWRDTAHTIFVPDTTDMWRIFSYATTYAKGAMALETVRDYLDDGPFWRGLRQFLADYRYGFARTPEFVRGVVSHWGHRITQAFIQSWIYTPGYPQARVLWETPSRLTLYPNRPYPMRVPIHLHGPQGQVISQMTFPLMEPTPISALQPLTRVIMDPDTATPYYQIRGSLSPTLPLIVYPNPTAQTIFIVSPDGPLSIALWNAQGQNVRQTPSESNSYALSLTGLSDGLYHMMIETPNGLTCKKILYTSP